MIVKTIHYGFSPLNSVVNNTVTNLPQLTIFLPESAKTFRSVVAIVTCTDIITATGGSVSNKTISLRLGASAYTSISENTLLANTGENIGFMFTGDFTSHFQTFWSGSSMTCDFQVLFNQTTGTTFGMSNVCVTLEITYECDELENNQIKSVFIPLNAPVAALPTTNTNYDTIPVLDTYLKESTKVFRNIHLVVYGNTNRAVTTDATITFRIGGASQVTGKFEGGLASDLMYRYVWNVTSVYPNTAATQAFNIQSTLARFHHPQVYLVVTYEYREDLTTQVTNSVLLPMEVDSPMGGITASDFQRAIRELMIQEPGPITTDRIAFYPYWSQTAPTVGLNMRIGNGSFIPYTDVATMVCGSNAAMVRNDSAFTLQRGRNILNFDCYRTSATEFGWNVSGFWIINYSSSKSNSGSLSHNRTISFSIRESLNTAPTMWGEITKTIPLPNTNYYLVAAGTRFIIMTNSTNQVSGFALQVERIVSEGGRYWERVYSDTLQTDPEAGFFISYSQMKSLFKRFSFQNLQDKDNRLTINVGRRWRYYTPGSISSSVMGYVSLNAIYTYHSIVFNSSLNITGPHSGDIDIQILDHVNNEIVAEFNILGASNTPINLTFSWHNNTEQITVVAKSTINGSSIYGVSETKIIGDGDFNIEFISPQEQPIYYSN